MYSICQEKYRYNGTLIDVTVVGYNDTKVLLSIKKNAHTNFTVDFFCVASLEGYNNSNDGTEIGVYVKSGEYFNTYG